MELKVNSKIPINGFFWTKFQGKVVRVVCHTIYCTFHSISEQDELIYFIHSYGIPEKDVFLTKKECLDELKKRHFNYGIH